MSNSLNNYFKISVYYVNLFSKILFILFLEKGREGERERKISMCHCLSSGPHWGPGLQPRHVP